MGRFLCGASLHRVAAGTLRSHWKVRGLEDWASLPVLLLLLSGFLFVINLVGLAFAGAAPNALLRVPVFIRTLQFYKTYDSNVFYF